MRDLKAKLPIIIMFLLLIIVVAYYALVFMPLQAKMEELSKEYDRVTDEIALNELQVQNIAKIQAEIDELESDASDYMSGFFRVSAEKLPEELWNMIVNSGIAPENINVGSPYTISSSNQVSIKVLEISLSYFGNISSVLNLLDILDNAEDVYYHITDLRISNAIETVPKIVEEDVDNTEVDEDNSEDSDEDIEEEIETIKISENISTSMRLLFYYPERPEA